MVSHTANPGTVIVPTEDNIKSINGKGGGGLHTHQVVGDIPGEHVVDVEFEGHCLALGRLQLALHYRAGLHREDEKAGPPVRLAPPPPAHLLACLLARRGARVRQVAGLARRVQGRSTATERRENGRRLK